MNSIGGFFFMKSIKRVLLMSSEIYPENKKILKKKNSKC